MPISPNVTPQQRADSLLAAWQLLRVMQIPALVRLPMIDALVEIEKAKNENRRSV